MKRAVVVTTYNRPDALAVVLAAYEKQRERDFEMIIADDGSTEETTRLVERFRERGTLQVRHVWHEDRGFRAAAIRNRAIAATGADYIIFSDGDCIPLPDFVTRHLRLAEAGWFVAGNRLLLTREFTERVVRNPDSFQTWTRSSLFASCLKGDMNRWHPLLPLPLGRELRHLTARRWQGVMTCNIGVWREDLLKINGFDESYHGWGLEDSDLVIRLIRSGVHHKTARFAAPVIHLWHREHDRSTFRKNQDMLDKVLKSGRTEAQKGIRQAS